MPAVTCFSSLSEAITYEKKKKKNMFLHRHGLTTIRFCGKPLVWPDLCFAQATIATGKKSRHNVFRASGIKPRHKRHQTSHETRNTFLTPVGFEPRTFGTTKLLPQPIRPRSHPRETALSEPSTL